MEKPQRQPAEPFPALQCNALTKSGGYIVEVTACKLVMTGGTLVMHEDKLVMTGGTLVMHEDTPIMQEGARSKTTRAAQIVHLIAEIVSLLVAVIGVITMLA